jgi:hypothetical protein
MLPEALAELAVLVVTAGCHLPAFEKRLQLAVTKLSSSTLKHEDGVIASARHHPNPVNSTPKNPLWLPAMG